MLCEEYSCLFDAEDFGLEEFHNWFEDLDARIFTLKHKVGNWLNEAEVDRNSGKSVRSKSSSHSKSSSGSLKSRLAVKKAKLAETGAEPKYVEKKQ